MNADIPVISFLFGPRNISVQFKEVDENVYRINAFQ